MRKRFKPSDRLPVRAKPNLGIVQVGKVWWCFPNVRRRSTSDEMVEQQILERLPRIMARKYFEKSRERRKDINGILGDVYVVIPNYPEHSISDIMVIINNLHDEPTDIVAVEICKKLNL